MNYCISDIHGEYDLLCLLLQKIRFSQDDKLYVLGDMIDKGKYSVKVLKLLYSLPNCICILGNHEYEFLKYYHSLMRMAQDYDSVLINLQDCFPYDGELLDWDIVDWLEGLPDYVETNSFLCVHAGVPLQDGAIADLDKYITEYFVYDRQFKDPEVLPQNSKCIIFGHTPTRYINGQDGIIFYPRYPQKSNSKDICDYYKIHIDTGVYLSKKLSCLRIDDCETITVSYADIK